MQMIKTDTYKELSCLAADEIRELVNRKRDCVLGLATGSTPIGMYEQLAALYRDGCIDFSAVTSVNLDEYRGLSPAHPQSYRFFMNHHLFEHINIDMHNTYVPLGEDTNAERVCADYDRLIAQCGPIDLQVLGIGHDGHIGFNEPDDHFTPGTHCVTLNPVTIRANRRFFASESEVPTQAYTMGIRPILQAGKVLLLASGKEKAGILKKALTGPITPLVPASILQLHPHLVVIGDAEALSEFGR